jgi:hypothetical protein
MTSAPEKKDGSGPAPVPAVLGPDCAVVVRNSSSTVAGKLDTCMPKAHGWMPFLYTMVASWLPEVLYASATATVGDLVDYLCQRWGTDTYLVEFSEGEPLEEDVLLQGVLRGRPAGCVAVVRTAAAASAAPGRRRSVLQVRVVAVDATGAVADMMVTVGRECTLLVLANLLASCRNVSPHAYYVDVPTHRALDDPALPLASLQGPQRTLLVLSSTPGAGGAGGGGAAGTTPVGADMVLVEVQLQPGPGFDGDGAHMGFAVTSRVKSLLTLSAFSVRVDALAKTVAMCYNCKEHCVSLWHNSVQLMPWSRLNDCIAPSSVTAKAGTTTAVGCPVYSVRLVATRAQGPSLA